MERRLLQILLVCLFIVLIYSCDEHYYPNTEDARNRIPLIHGRLTNNPGPYEVTLFWASSLLNSRIDSIEDATVFISDENGEKEELVMIRSGHYLTKEGFRGIPGKTYTLHVQLPNGDIYQSTPTRLESTNFTDSIYHQTGTETDYTTNLYGQYLVTTYRGLHHYVDISVDATTQRYYYARTRMVSQFLYKTLRGLNYVWEISNLDKTPNLKATIQNNDREIIQGHQLGFVRYVEGNSHQAGWILKTKIYSISKEVFDYYQLIQSQANTNNHIFDPIPSKITGNLRCVTDTSKIAFGVFEVAEEYIRNVAVYWSPMSNVIKRVNLPQNYEGPLTNGSKLDTVSTIPPDFWVVF